MKRYLIAAFVLVVLIAGGTVLLERLRAGTPVPSQDQLYLLATTSPRGRFSGIPRRHKVSVEPLDANALQVALAYFQRSRSGGFQERAGSYDDGSGVITILSDEVRYESTLPPGLRPDFEHTVRHEYGHAFLDDLLKTGKPAASRREEQSTAAAQGSTTRKLLAFVPYGDGSKPDASWPAALQPVLHEFHHQPRDIYGSPYYTATFGEYLAESYARFCEGRPVPRVTNAFFAARVGR